MRRLLRITRRLGYLVVALAGVWSWAETRYVSERDQHYRAHTVRLDADRGRSPFGSFY